MNGTAVLHSIIDGVLTGSVYALMATGLTLIFGVMNIINVAQGILVILGAYLSYTLGKLMIRKLRTDWVAKHAAAGSSAAAADDQALWHDFHDQFLSYGGPPIPLLRKEMMGEAGTLL